MKQNFVHDKEILSFARHQEICVPILVFCKKTFYYLLINCLVNATMISFVEKDKCEPIRGPENNVYNKKNTEFRHTLGSQIYQRIYKSKFDSRILKI